VAKAYLELARTIDLGLVATKDLAGVVREMRLIYVTLDAMAPHKPAGDFVDEMQAHRERRMREAASSVQ